MNLKDDKFIWKNKINPKRRNFKFGEEYALNSVFNNKEVTKVNKSELITSIAEKSKLTKKDAEAALKGIIESIEETLEKGEKVQLVGFGTFETRARAARMGRNPRTKEEIQIAASTVPVFKAGKEFKDIVNK